MLVRCGKIQINLRLISVQVLPVSKKVHTTRCNAQGIITKEDTQLVRIDKNELKYKIRIDVLIRMSKCNQLGTTYNVYPYNVYEVFFLSIPVFLNICPLLYNFTWSTFTSTIRNNEQWHNHHLFQGWKARCNTTNTSKRQRWTRGLSWVWKSMFWSLLTSVCCVMFLVSLLGCRCPGSPVQLVVPVLLVEKYCSVSMCVGRCLAPEDFCRN